MVSLLKGIGDLITSPFGGPQLALQESLTCNWMAIKLRVERGDIDPGAAIYVAELEPGRGSGYMTVQSVLKTVQEGWGCWDRKTTARWCEVLHRANNGSVDDA